MIETVTGLYYLLRVSRVKSDGLVFRLHALTTILMLAFSVIISSKQTVGNPIECVHTRDIPVEAFNAYCWIHSTYFVTGAMLGVAGANVAFPGVASSFGILQSRHQDDDHRRIDDQTKRVKYYQWVAFVLIFQVCILMGKFKFPLKLYILNVYCAAFFALWLVKPFVRRFVRVQQLCRVLIPIALFYTFIL